MYCISDACWFSRPAVVLLLLVLSSSNLVADENSTEFDVPALIGVREHRSLPVYGPELPATFSSELNEKTIEVILPIPSVIDSSDRDNVQEFRFDVSWIHSVYPVIDFGPKTQTVSDVEGLLTVEKNADNNSSATFNFTTKQLDLGNGNLNADFGKRDSQRLSFQEVPQHDVLVASGTIARGTGSFFRFHSSKTETLEGSRNLSLAYRVPENWRNGMLKVNCQAIGKRRVGFWNEPFSIKRSFVVPLFVAGDPVGQQIAIDFIRAEQNLRKSWLEFETKLRKSRSSFPFGFGQPASKLPNDWPHLLIQSGNDEYFSKYQNYLSKDVAISAEKLVQARKSLK